tara:strand:- start:172 stop:309 length:138 start_codon:yes stop_codon:yes gene_type:complete
VLKRRLVRGRVEMASKRSNAMKRCMGYMKAVRKGKKKKPVRKKKS